MNKNNSLLITSDRFYDYIGSIGGYYGDAFKLLLKAKLEAGVAKSVLKAPEMGPEAESIFLDALISTAHIYGMSSGMRGSSCPLALPAGLSDISLNFQPSKTYNVETILKGREGNLEYFDIKATTSEGELVADLKDFKFSRMALSQFDSRNKTAASLAHRVKWIPLPSLNESIPPTVYVSSLNAPDAKKWCKAINSMGASKANFLDLNQAKNVSLNDREVGIAFIYICNQGDDWNDINNTLPKEVALDVLKWQEYVSKVSSHAPSIVVTTNAQYLPESNILPNPTNASCWAAAGSLAQSIGGESISVLDLHGDISAEKKVVALSQFFSSKERFAVYQNNKFLGFAIERCNEKSLLMNKPQPNLEQTSVLVTGASGAIANHVMEWSGEEGAKEITAWSRKNCDTRTSLPDRYQLNHIKGSISDPSLWQVNDNKYDVIFHLAGVNPTAITDSPSTQADLAFDAKYYGLLNITNYLESAKPTRLVHFSTIAAINGSTDQLFYSAANAAATAAAINLTEKTHHKLNVIHFGPWAGGGMADDPKLKKIINAKGLEYLEPWEALRAMYLIINRDETISIVSSFNDNYTLNIVNDENGVEQPTAITKAQLLLLENMDDTEKLGVILNEIKEQAAISLDTDIETIETDANLFDMGFDSLMALEMRNALSKKYDVKINLNILMGAHSLDELATASLPVIKAAIKERISNISVQPKEKSLVL